MRYRRKRRLFDPVMCLVLIMVCGLLARSQFAMATEERMWRTQVREVLQQQFPEAFVTLRAEYGLSRFVPTGKTPGRGQHVILVHGLDDPGLVWQDLAPALTVQGYRVWLMNYPNDQPVRDSAIFFYQQLKEFARLEGVAPVAVICHSMGGLVTREMTTQPQIGYAMAEKARLVPPFSCFIMIGTPNHGSVFSRLRIVTEIRDQVVSGSQKGFHWLRPISDGAGEAALDLYPGSEFLSELNSRPLTAVGRMLVIAGTMSPFDKKEVETFLHEFRGSLPFNVQPPHSLESSLEGMIDQIGDGLVSVESARLPGVPLVLVQGTHLTIIRNPDEGNSRIPPAVPVILGELTGSKP